MPLLLLILIDRKIEHGSAFDLFFNNAELDSRSICRSKEHDSEGFPSISQHHQVQLSKNIATQRSMKKKKRWMLAVGLGLARCLIMILHCRCVLH